MGFHERVFITNESITVVSGFNYLRKLIRSLTALSRLPVPPLLPSPAPAPCPVSPSGSGSARLAVMSRC